MFRFSWSHARHIRRCSFIRKIRCIPEGRSKPICLLSNLDGANLGMRRRQLENSMMDDGYTYISVAYKRSLNLWWASHRSGSICSVEISFTERFLPVFSFKVIIFYSFELIRLYTSEVDRITIWIRSGNIKGSNPTSPTKVMFCNPSIKRIRSDIIPRSV